MRISDDRYSRDRQRLDIAMKFIRREARTRTIRRWTGLSDDRIRKLYRSYLQDGGCILARHRGKSPQQAAFFLRTARVRHQAAALAGLCCLVGLFGGGFPRLGGRSSTRVANAAALCQAYDVYCAVVRAPAIGFEHAVLLLDALHGRGELRLGNCHGCGALLVVDPLALRHARCAPCAAGFARQGGGCNVARRAAGTVHEP